MKTTLRILFVFALFGLLLAMPGARDDSDDDATESTITEKEPDSEQVDADENQPKETAKRSVENAKDAENTKGNSKAKEQQANPLKMLKPILEMPGAMIGGAAGMVNSMIGGALDSFSKGLSGAN